MLELDLPVDMEVVQSWAERRLGSSVRLQLSGLVPLVGGFVSSAVIRLDLEASTPAGEPEALSVVFKRVAENEVLAMRAIQSVPQRSVALPELIDDGRDGEGWWLVMPFFAGGETAEAIPAPVFHALAQLHAAYLGREEDLRDFESTDHRYWRDLCLDVVLARVEEALAQQAHPQLERARRSILDRVDDARFLGAMEVLPRTLVHGDMHPGNVLVTPAVSTIVDWGNARVAPAMLDLANITEPGAPSFSSYLESWEAITGQPADPWLTDVGFLWAAAYINTLYMGFTVQRDFLGIDGPARLPAEYLGTMIDRADRALDQLGERLRLRS